ncbi:MAG: Sec-independent protein translocase subunit TatA/TatB [Desulfomonilaceae bacterium]
MFGISMYELGLIALIGLIFLGPRQLAETAKIVGRLVRELQRMASDVQNSINFDLDSPSKTSSQPSYNYNVDAIGLTSETPSSVHSAEKDSNSHETEKLGPDFYAELLASSAEPVISPQEDPIAPGTNIKEEKLEEKLLKPGS